jgi:ABC-type phosphate/phosphonate transport system substrate-binding protein
VKINARMYSVTPRATAAWRTLIDWALARAGVAGEWLDHPPPKAISDMWARDDLVCAQMCGLPFSLRVPQATLLAAPVPSPPDYGGRSVYWSYIAVRADSPYRTLEDTFGKVAGYTVKDSQSGYFAFRHHLMQRAPGKTPYAKIVGGLVNPRGVVAALADGRIDVGPLDSYVFDLIRDGDPAFAAQVRIIDTTDPTPMPPLVTTLPAMPADAVAGLRNAFAAAGSEPALADARRALLIERFMLPDAAAFKVQKQRHDRVVAEAALWP